MLGEPLYPLHARYFVAGDSLRSSTPNLLVYRKSNGDIHGANVLKQVSPVAWQHINFYGRYEFNKHVEFINMETIIHELAELQVIEC